jgi:hypothetical protein
MERGGEGPLFAPLPPEDATASQVPLAELEGLSPEIVAILAGAGYETLDDVFDLDREELSAVPGLSTEQVDSLMAFLAELADEDSEENGAPA